MPMPVVRTEERDDGGVRVTVRLTRPGWQKLFGGSAEIEKSFGLDFIGREVYEACDGKRNVEKIVRQFSKAHKINRAEAEVSVTTYLKTLMSRGMIAMVVPED